jgi:hypothetical protein
LFNQIKLSNLRGALRHFEVAFCMDILVLSLLQVEGSSVQLLFILFNRGHISVVFEGAGLPLLITGTRSRILFMGLALVKFVNFVSF